MRASGSVKRLLASTLIVLVACGGGADSKGAVVSADGRVSLKIPDGAAPEGTEVSVMAAAAPDGLGEAAEHLLGSVYSLEPSGTSFSKPVEVTIKVKRSGALPVAFGAVRDDDGKWTQLADQSIEPSQEGFVLKGTLDHFSKVAVFGGAVTLSLRPERLSIPVGTTHAVHLESRGTEGWRIALTVETRVFTPEGIAVAERGLWARDLGESASFQVRCVTAGETRLALTVEVRDAYSENWLTALIGADEISRRTVSISLPVSCTDSSGEPEPKPEPSGQGQQPVVEKACAVVKGSGSSRLIRWRMFLNGVAPGSGLTLVVAGAQGGPATISSHISGINAIETKIPAAGGTFTVTSFVMENDFHGKVDLTQGLNDATGPVEVGAANKTFGDCPPGK